MKYLDINSTRLYHVGLSHTDLGHFNGHHASLNYANKSYMGLNCAILYYAILGYIKKNHIHLDNSQASLLYKIIIYTRVQNLNNNRELEDVTTSLKFNKNNK